jgi:hypothetical protein
MSRPKRDLKRRNPVLGQFVAHTFEMRASPAWRAIPANARLVLDRLEFEHLAHGGAENGSLKCTYSDFERHGIRRASVAQAIRAAVALGFIEVTYQGGRSISDFRAPSRYRLTYLVGCGRSPAPTNEWKCIKSDEDAQKALFQAEQAKNYGTQPAHTPKKAGRKNEPGDERENEPVAA